MSVAERHRSLAPVRLIEAMNRRDWETVSSLLAPDVVLKLALSRETIRGRDEFIAFNRGYPGAWDIAIDQVVADADREAVVLRLTVTIGEHREEVVREQRNVRLALAKRRQVQRDDLETIEQVFAEAAVQHHLVQRTVRRRDHAHVDANGRR